MVKIVIGVVGGLLMLGVLGYNLYDTFGKKGDK